MRLCNGKFSGAQTECTENMIRRLVQLFPNLNQLRFHLEVYQQIICCCVILFTIKAGLTIIPVINLKVVNVFLQEYMIYLAILNCNVCYAKVKSK